MEKVLIEALTRQLGPTAARCPSSEGVRKCLGFEPPSDYIELLASLNGFEGLVHGSFVRIYDLDRVAEVNSAVRACGTANALVVIGDNGGGEAFAYDSGSEVRPLVKIPFIPLDRKYEKYVSTNLDGLIKAVAGTVDVAAHLAMPKDEFRGCVIHEVKPIIFGGSPTDTKNKIVVPLSKYLELVVWWNQQYVAALKAQGSRPR